MTDSTKRAIAADMQAVYAWAVPVRYQWTWHGYTRYSVQAFDPAGRLLADWNIKGEVGS